MNSPLPVDTQVIVAGAGPVGLLTAIDLGRRGVQVTLVEREPTTAPWPKMDRSNARTMEMFRRMGIADEVRALGYPADNPMDVFICTRLVDEPIAVLRCPSVVESRDEIAQCSDGSQPLEPYQLVSQNKLEPLLSRIAETTPNVTVRYDTAVESFEQDGTGVSVSLRTNSTASQRIRGGYLVGADGGRSIVRKSLGIPLEGDGALADVVQVIFRSRDLYDRIPMGKGRHYIFADAHRSTLVVQGDRVEFTFHTSLPCDSDFTSAIRALVGFDIDLQIRHIVPWRYHLLVAQRYRDGRVFLAGDAAHLVIPTGGLGMNTGVGDALDLSWKIAGTLAGWGGPELLESYERERRPVGLRNREASGWAAAEMSQWRSATSPQAPANTDVAKAAQLHFGRMYSMRGVELGYSYAGSTIVANESTVPARWDTLDYVPSAEPGSRIPHMWLGDGRALQDVLGADWTLLDLSGERDTEPLVRAFRASTATLDVVCLPHEHHLRTAYGAGLLLLRPDLHVCWRGDDLPVDTRALVQLVTGHCPDIKAHNDKGLQQ